MLLSVRNIGIVLLLVAAGALTSCGGGDASTSPEEPITKAEFIKRADAICSKTEKRQLALVDEYQQKRRAEGAAGPPDSNAEAEIVTFAGLPPLSTQLEELAALPPPESNKELVHTYLRAMEAGIKAVEDDPQLLLRRESDPFAKAAALASKVGFEVCQGA